MRGLNGPTIEISVRVAREDDTDALGLLLRQSYSELMAASYSPETLAAALPFLVKPNPGLLSFGTFYLAETRADNYVVGCGGWTFERPGKSGESNDPKLGHLRHFATHPSLIRRGVGRKLFDRCMAAGRASGVVEFECHSSLAAEAFYLALGFTAVEPMVIELRHGISLPGVRMAYQLAD